MRKILLGLSSLIAGVMIFYLFQPQVAVAEDFQQPIAFSHKTHASDNKVPCEFCHIYARRSNSSGIPPLVTCNQCHSVIKGTKDDQKKEIKKIEEYWNKKQPVPWKKIHDLPDFVHFSHKRHVQAGFDCTECHGEISNLDVITMDDMKADLSMGWCVDCHKKEHITSGDKVIGQVRETRGGPVVQNAPQPKQDGTLQGSKDCYICHK
ncbi:MAG: cytochrome c family protein [Deltaproteobacteria bacterium]|nr:cytochrome c family protein [Deltaproteobacteria bacterium]